MKCTNQHIIKSFFPAIHILIHVICITCPDKILMSKLFFLHCIYTYLFLKTFSVLLAFVKAFSQIVLKTVITLLTLD